MWPSLQEASGKSLHPPSFSAKLLASCSPGVSGRLTGVDRRAYRRAM